MQILVRHNRVIDACETGYINMGEYVLCEEKQKAFYDCSPVVVDTIPNDLEFYNYYYIGGKFVREFPVYQTEPFSADTWTQVSASLRERYQQALSTKRPIIAVYRMNEDGSHSLVTNADISIATDRSQTIEATTAFAGYAITL